MALLPMATELLPMDRQACRVILAEQWEPSFRHSVDELLPGIDSCCSDSVQMRCSRTLASVELEVHNFVVAADKTAPPLVED